MKILNSLDVKVNLTKNTKKFVIKILTLNQAL